MRIFQLLIISLIIASCSVKKEKLIGQYEMKDNSQTRIIIYPDSTFQLYSAEQNPFLHPFEHPDKYFFTTKGFWEVSKKKLLITSDTIVEGEQSIEIIGETTIDYDGLEVIFLDYKNDTIPVLEVAIGDSFSVAAFHSAMPYFYFKPADFKSSNLDVNKLTKNADSLKFTFYGYPPITYSFEMLIGHKYTFRLFPILKPSLFFQKPMTIRKNKLVDKEYNYKFFKRKTKDVVF